MDKKTKKLLLYLLLLPLALGIIATLVLSNSAPASVPASMQGFGNTVKGWPVGWWRSIQSQQASFWPADMYHAYDTGALVEDIVIFYIAFALTMYIAFRKRILR